jgi:hypothetical protein
MTSRRSLQESSMIYPDQTNIFFQMATTNRACAMPFFVSAQGPTATLATERVLYQAMRRVQAVIGALHEFHANSTRPLGEFAHMKAMPKKKTTTGRHVTIASWGCASYLFLSSLSSFDLLKTPHHQFNTPDHHVSTPQFSSPHPQVLPTTPSNNDDADTHQPFPYGSHLQHGKASLGCSLQLWRRPCPTTFEQPCHDISW